MNFIRRRNRLKVCLIFALPIVVLIPLLLQVSGSQCSLVKETAKCGGMNLNAIPQDLPISITRLDLSNNSLANIDWIPLRRYKKTSVLIMQSCNVNTIPADAFQKLQQLKHVDLSYNRLSQVNNQIFKYNTKLDEVLLNGNNLLLDSTSPFLISSSITRLELRDCDIRQISSVTFSEMKKLKYLDLSMNKVILLDSDSFKYSEFRELLIDPIEEISTDLGKVCDNGVMVRYVVGDKFENWCETKKSPEIETKRTYVNRFEKSVTTWAPIPLFTFAVLYVLYRKIRSWRRRDVDEEAPHQIDLKPLKNESDDQENENLSTSRDI